MHHLHIRPLVISLALIVAPASMAAVRAVAPIALAGPQSQAHVADQLQLRWQLIRNVLRADGTGGRALARLRLTNRGSEPLPRSGWAIYFNSIDGVVAEDLPSGMVMEQVSGQLYRMRPGPGFAGVKPGASIDIDYSHRAVLVTTVKAPLGPYLVFDAHPETGHRIGDYQIALMSTPAQLDGGPTEPTRLTTPELLYAHNARIRDVPVSALAPVFPTPVQLEPRKGVLHLAAMPAIEADRALANEAAVATAMLARYLEKAQGAVGGAPLRLRLRVAPVAGHDSSTSIRPRASC
jgi:hexosaminidase